MEIIPEDEYDQELKVTFQPELYLQRRIWILDILRKEQITKVSLVGNPPPKKTHTQRIRITH